MSTAVATTGSFTGADVDGLDHLSQEFNGAAEIVDMVKAACEVIVAAASIFGPFGAAFVAYLKGTVIPWLTKVSMALKAMSKVLASHSNAQKDASSSSTSLAALPSYQGTTLPSTSTHDAPALPPAAATSTPAAATPAPAPVTSSGSGTSVATPPTIGGTTPATSGTPAATGTSAGTPPFVAAVTALTGLVTAVDHLIHPHADAAGATTPTDAGTTPASTTTPTDAGTTPTTPAMGSTGGIDLSTLHPLHPGDTVGVLSIPVDIAPDGTVTPLGHAVTAGTTPDVPVHQPDATSAPTSSSAAPAHAAVPAPSGSGGGPALGSGAGGDAPVITSAPPVPDAVTTAAHPDAAGDAATAAAPTEPGLRTERIGSHDGLFTGLGQATGIGAGAAALARAVLTEARQGADGSLLGAVPLPFEAGADDAVRTEIYQGSIT